MTKNPIIKAVSVSLLRAPLIYPFRTALGEHKNLENVLLTIQLDNGTKGFGEAAVAPHITGETIEKTVRNLNSLKERLPGSRISSYLKFSNECRVLWPNNMSAVAALDMALLDALTRQQKIPLWKYFGPKAIVLRTDITIVIAGLAETEGTVKKFYRQGFRAFKIKVGRDPDLDLKRMIIVKKNAPCASLYLDMNQGYSADESLKFLKTLKQKRIKLHLIEQPVKKGDWEGLKKVSRFAGAPVCADESVATISDVARAIKEKAVRAINIKFMKSGIFQAREIALLAKKNGLKLMMGAMMESPLAIMAAAHFAAGLGCFDYVDLDTPFFMVRRASLAHHEYKRRTILSERRTTARSESKDLSNEKDSNMNVRLQKVITAKFMLSPYLSPRGIYDLKKVKTGIGIIP